MPCLKARAYVGLITAILTICTVVSLVLAIRQIGIKEVKVLEDYPAFQKGMNYAEWSKEGYLSFTSDDSLRELTKTKTEWVALVVTWYQDRFDSPEIKPTYRSPNDESLIHAIRKIKELGMKVMLKPHLDLLDVTDGKWRTDIKLDSEDEWRQWFDSYKKFIKHYVEIANLEGVELFCIGTELSNSTINYPDKWRQLILEIRDIYQGRLTYAANWYDEYSSIEFWDMLDYAGVDPYFPLTEDESPTLRELKKAWEPWAKELEEWQATINRPVIFTEVGYKSSQGAANNPWEHVPSGELDLEVQRDCYQAFFETFFYKDWLWGIYWWHWQSSIVSEPEMNRDFSPRGKPAQNVLLRWYKRLNPGIDKMSSWKIRNKKIKKK